MTGENSNHHAPSNATMRHQHKKPRTSSEVMRKTNDCNIQTRASLDLQNSVLDVPPQCQSWQSEFQTVVQEFSNPKVSVAQRALFVSNRAQAHPIKLPGNGYSFQIHGHRKKNRKLTITDQEYKPPSDATTRHHKKTDKNFRKQESESLQNRPRKNIKDDDF